MRWLFGAHGQVVIGVLTTAVAAAAWAWWTFHPPTLAVVFHISMFFGLVACYGLIATGLGYRATERVETAVVENIENADQVSVGD